MAEASPSPAATRIEGAAHRHAAVSEFRQHPLGTRALPACIVCGSVSCQRSLRPARAPPVCRLVRPAKTIIKSLPRLSVCFCCPARNPSPPDHQRDRHDAPRNAEHRQSRSEFVRPERADRIEKEVTQGHCRTTCCSFRSEPAMSSVLTPFEIPSLTGISSCPFRPLRPGLQRSLPLPVIDHGVLRHAAGLPSSLPGSLRRSRSCWPSAHRRDF